MIDILKYCHDEKNAFHYDLKECKFLLDDSYDLKLTDFSSEPSLTNQGHWKVKCTKGYYPP